MTITARFSWGISAPPALGRDLLVTGDPGQADAHRPAVRRQQGLHAGPRHAEEHTSELQSRQYLVCRLLLEKNKKQNSTNHRIKKKKKHETTKQQKERQ